MRTSRVKKKQASRLGNDQIIDLNVGGESFSTTYGTLKQSTYFKDLFNNGTVTSENFIDGQLFIDRSSRLFTHILQYMRNGEINLDGNDDNLDGLKSEAQFFNLLNLVQVIDNYCMRTSESEKAKEYELLDINDLKKIACITSASGTHRSISDSYEIISVVEYQGLYYECTRHGRLSDCPDNCGSPFVRKWTSKPIQKLLVTKK